MRGYLLLRSQKSQSKVDTTYIFSCIHAATEMNHSRLKLECIPSKGMLATLHSIHAHLIAAYLALLLLSIVNDNHACKQKCKWQCQNKSNLVCTVNGNNHSSQDQSRQANEIVVDGSCKRRWRGVVPGCRIECIDGRSEFMRAHLRNCFECLAVVSQPFATYKSLQIKRVLICKSISAVNTMQGFHIKCKKEKKMRKRLLVIVCFIFIYITYISATPYYCYQPIHPSFLKGAHMGKGDPFQQGSS